MWKKKYFEFERKGKKRNIKTIFVPIIIGVFRIVWKIFAKWLGELEMWVRIQSNRTLLLNRQESWEEIRLQSSLAVTWSLASTSNY